MEIAMMSVPWMGAAPNAKLAIEPSSKPKIDLRTENAPKRTRNEGVTGPEQKPRPTKPDFDSSTSTVRSTLPKALKIDESSLARSASADQAGEIDLSALQVDASGNADAAIVAAEFFLPVPVTLVPTPAALQPSAELASMGVADVAAFETKVALAAEFATSGNGPVRQAPIPVHLSAETTESIPVGAANDLATPEELAFVSAPANDLATPEELAFVSAPANDLETAAESAPLSVPANDLATPEELKQAEAFYAAQQAEELAIKTKLNVVDPQAAIDLATPEELAFVSAPANDLASPEELKQAEGFYAAQQAEELAIKTKLSDVAPQPASDLATPEELAFASAPANDLATPEELKRAEGFYAAQQAEALATKTKLNYLAPQPSSDLATPEELAFVSAPATDLATEAELAYRGQASADVADAPQGADLLSKAPVSAAQVASGMKNDALKQAFRMAAAPAEVVDAPKEDASDILTTATDKPASNFVMATETKTSFANGAVGVKDRSLNAVETASVLKQVADRMEMLAAAKPKDGVTIQLDPGDLGQIILKVKGSGNDVAAEITAQHDGVRQALEQNKAQLTQNLESKGLNLNQVTINTSTDPKQGFADAQTRQQTQSQPNTNSRPGLGSESTGVVWGADQIRNYSRRATGVDFFA